MRRYTIAALCGMFSLGVATTLDSAQQRTPYSLLETTVQIVAPQADTPPPIYDASAVCIPPLLDADSQSLGMPHKGKLKNGIALPDNPCIDAQSLHHYGTSELITTITRAAYETYLDYGVRTEVHDLSRMGGGLLSPHRSHQNGLDADISLFHYDPKTQEYSTAYRPIGRNDNPQTWDINWNFIKIIQQEGYPIQAIFIDKDYIAKLRRHVLRYHREQEWDQYGKVLHHEPGHKDHFHIRIEASSPPILLAQTEGKKG